jgi:hypothetical protein
MLRAFGEMDTVVEIGALMVISGSFGHSQASALHLFDLFDIHRDYMTGIMTYGFPGRTVISSRSLQRK